MKEFGITATLVFVATVLFLFLMLDGGGNEVDLGLFFAPPNALCGLALCVVAFRRGLKWSFAFGLTMLVTWPFFTLMLMVADRGIVRQLTACATNILYMTAGASFLYASLAAKEWSGVSASDTTEGRSGSRMERSRRRDRGV